MGHELGKGSLRLGVDALGPGVVALEEVGVALSLELLGLGLVVHHGGGY